MVNTYSSGGAIIRTQNVSLQASLVFKHFVESSSQHDSSDFTCAGSNLVQLGISQEAASGVFVDVTIAT